MAFARRMTRAAQPGRTAPVAALPLRPPDARRHHRSRSPPARLDWGVETFAAPGTTRRRSRRGSSTVARRGAGRAGQPKPVPQAVAARGCTDRLRCAGDDRRRSATSARKSHSRRHRLSGPLRARRLERRLERLGQLRWRQRRRRTLVHPADRLAPPAPAWLSSHTSATCGVPSRSSSWRTSSLTTSQDVKLELPAVVALLRGRRKAPSSRSPTAGPRASLDDVLRSPRACRRRSTVCSDGSERRVGAARSPFQHVAGLVVASARWT